MPRFSHQPAHGFPAHAEGGLTLVELMVSLALGLLVVLVATALLVSSKSAYLQTDDSARIEETGRYALETIARAIRQTAYENWDAEAAPIGTVPDFSASIAGLDARTLRQATSGIDSPLTTAINGSDVLALRFFGAGHGAAGDGSILNCAGFGVSATSLVAGAGQDDGRGWSIFYIAKSSSGEPELRCKYRGKTTWASDALVAGVESFQVLYGLDTDGDGVPNTYLNASAIDELDATLLLEGENVAARMRDKNRKTFWKKVAVVKFALLIRSSTARGAGDDTTQYDLFGENYGELAGESDPGTRIKLSQLPEAGRYRMRKIFTQTIQLRNPDNRGGQL